MPNRNLEGSAMKHSKSAMRSHHVRVAHMAVTQPLAPTTTERTDGRPRFFSTDRERAITNGVVVPEQLRQKIETAFPRVASEPEVPPQSSFSVWGFL